MSLYVASLNSGSNGNCYYIGDENTAILVDAGLSCRETEKRLKRLGLAIGNIKAIFVSHEHDDHIKGIPVIAKKHRIPLYITPGTLNNGGPTLEGIAASAFRAYETITIDALQITAFPKFHDAADPHSFIIAKTSLATTDIASTASPVHGHPSSPSGDAPITTVIGVFTDIGAPCEHLVRHFRQCHAVFLETNYDESMLDQGSYPWHLKQRIRGGNGHLSNRQALELFLVHRPPFMTHLFLSHLSQNNNNPDKVQDLFRENAAGVKIILASRYEETRLYTIAGTPASSHSTHSAHPIPSTAPAIAVPPAIPSPSALSSTIPSPATLPAAHGSTSEQKAPPATTNQRGRVRDRIRPQTNPLQTSLF